MENIPILTCKYVGLPFCGSVNLYGSSWSKGKQYRPEIWYTHSLDHIQKQAFCFFEKVTLMAASLEKKPYRMDFPHFLDCLVFVFLSKKHMLFFFAFANTAAFSDCIINLPDTDVAGSLYLLVYLSNLLSLFQT